MRIVIDLQGAQSASRDRGIGRYSLSLAQGIARNRGEREILILLSDLFPDTISDIRSAFDGILSSDAIRVWTAPHPTSWRDPSNVDRRRSAELLREAYLISLEPDVVVVTSLFEGWVDDAVTSVGRLTYIPTAVILYDLIPLIYPNDYLSMDAMRAWYQDKISSLKHADYLLSISASAANEARSILSWDAQRISNISTAADSRFRRLEISEEDKSHILRKYAFTREYLMYTGGIDHRKNIEALIRSFARLPPDIRTSHQLAVVCNISDADRKRLTKLSQTAGLEDDDIVLTGFVSDEDLVKLYNLCKAFVFPSLHEGFGLPALEAMQIGRAVIASNTSSLPEVVGRADALFDPRDEASITAQMLRVLSNSSYRQDLEQHGPIQAENFGWDATAKRAIDALECLLERRGDPMPGLTGKKGKKPRLAFVSPLPPAQSGIADYAAALMQVLTVHYEIVAITEQSKVSDPWITASIPVQNSAWLRRHAREFEHVLYHFGNSDFHEHMFDLLQVVPGTVVLHDFFLSGVLNYMGQEFWTSYMLKSHGFDGLHETRDSEGRQRAILTYPANLPVLQNAVGVIVHSDWSKQLAQHWYGAGAASTWVAVPFLRKLPDVNPGLRLEAKRRLGFGDDDFIVCSFGLVAETKQSIEILEAFASLGSVARRGVKLVFIGNCGGPYGERLRCARRDLALEKFVDITGVVAPVAYNDYLLAADMCVQLRTQSRGETSAAVFDCLAYGLPTIINANGAMAEIDPDAAYIIPDQFSAHELADALSNLIGSVELRKRIGSKARLLVQEHHNPELCALKYRDALEGFHSLASDTIWKIPDLLASIDMKGVDDRSLAISLAANFPPWPRKPTMFVDVSPIAEIDLLTDAQKVARAISKALISVTGTPLTILPVRETKYGEYVLASRYAEQFVTFPAVHDVLEVPIEPAPGDVFLGLDLNPILGQRSLEELKRLNRKGIKVFNVVHDLLPMQQPGHLDNPGQFEKWLSNILSFDGAICTSQAIAIDLMDQISAQAQRRTPSFSVDWFPLGSDIAASAPSDRTRKLTWEESARELLRIVEIRSSDAPSARSETLHH